MSSGKTRGSVFKIAYLYSFVERKTNSFALFLSCPQAFCYFAKNIEKN